MKKVAVALILLTSTTALSACGIGAGPVVSHSKADQGDQRFNQLSGSKSLERPERARDPIELVKKYLNAAADKPDTRTKTLLSYMKNKNWTPSDNEINIYRVYEPTTQGQSVTTTPIEVPMQKVGKLLKDGRIEPVYAGQTKMVFNVEDGPDGYLLKDAPSELMLSDAMLQNDWYDARPIYFWDKSGARLVPDIRYISSRLQEHEKAKLLVEALYAGPSSWLIQAVRPAAGQVRNNPVFSTNGTMSIDLPSQLGDDELSRLATQLDRILKSKDVPNVQLKIQGVPVQPSRSPVIDDSRPPAARFAVQQNKVVRLDSGSERGSSALPLADTTNTNVDWAMFSRGEESVAISRKEGGAQLFMIGPSRAPWRLTMPGGKPVDQAVWLEGVSRAALVLSNKTLYEVVPGETAKVTPLAGGLPGPVTSFSVVPDGRLALVIDKKLYMAAVYQGAEGLTVTQPQQVPTALDQVQHVALTQFNVIIAGIGPEQKLVLTQINVDGCAQQPAWKEYSDSEQISHLVADYRNGAAAYYDYIGDAQQLGPGGASPVRENKVVPVPGASPAPSTSPAPALPISAASFEG